MGSACWSGCFVVDCLAAVQVITLRLRGMILVEECYEKTLVNRLERQRDCGNKEPLKAERQRKTWIKERNLELRCRDSEETSEPIS